MKHLIDDYAISPGDHCGSAAMRGLLRYYADLDLPEPVVFGLGAGLATGFVQTPESPFACMIFGRQPDLELDLGRHLQIDYRERTEEDDDEAWRVVREEVLANRPTMLVGDIFYLDYRDYTVNFPSHRFVLLGFDDEAERVFIADRINETPEVCSLGAVRESRNPKSGTTDRNRWGRFHGTDVGSTLRDAAEAALRTCTGNMSGGYVAGDEESPLSSFQLGAAATKSAAAALPGLWDAPNAVETAKFNAACLEKFGNGGGNFRRLYAGFLDWAYTLDAALVPEDGGDRMRAAADHWTAASAALFRASESPGDPGPWAEAGAEVGEAHVIETALFDAISDRLG